jgi:hypothetical protein
MAISKIETRRRATRALVKQLLKQIVAGQVEVYVGYRRLYGQWCKNNAAVQELRPMFRIPGIAPDGMLSVSENFKSQVISKAKEILQSFEMERDTEAKE